MLNQEQQKLFSSLTPNTLIQVIFAEITDPIWIRPAKDDALLHFGDETAEPLDATAIVKIIRGETDRWQVLEVYGDRLALVNDERVGDEDEDITITITAAHLRDLVVLQPGDRWTRRESIVPDLSYTFVQAADGFLEVGCQRIGTAGQRKIVDLLAERLDLEVRPAGTGAHEGESFAALEAVVSKLHTFPTCLDELLGEDLYVQVMRALGRDDVLAERGTP